MKRFVNFMSSRGFIIGVMAILFLFVSTSFAEAEKTEKIQEKAFLGVSVEKLSAEELKEMNISHGVRVIDVVEGEAAEKAGIQEDDILQYFNQKKIETPGDLVEAVRSSHPAKEVKIKLLRDKKSSEVKAILGTRESRRKFLHWPDGKAFFYHIRGGAYLGIVMQRLDSELAEYFQVKADGGVLILQVEKQSPAQKAGLKAGDVVIQLSEKKIQVPEDISRMVSEMKKGDKVDIIVMRHGKKEVFKVEAGERETFREWKMLRRHDGKRCRIEIPEIHIPEIEVDIPDFEECKVIVDRHLEKVKERLERVKGRIERKIKRVHECRYI